MKKKFLSAIALMTCFTSIFSMGACNFGGGGDSSTTDSGSNGNHITVDPLNLEGFDSTFLPHKQSIKQ